ALRNRGLADRKPPAGETLETRPVAG
ncbi:MAG: hypothetical protein JWQ89_3609, partial [Devosia sp.]|nr:hypothetical protein [Devosia sp.]